MGATDRKFGKTSGGTNDHGTSFLGALLEAYGYRLLGMLAFAQWLCKGLAWGFALTSMEFLLREYGIAGPKMQVYKAVAMLPWAMKPIFGMVSDLVPICGYQKAPYIIFVSFLAMAAHTTVGFDVHHNLEVQVIVACLAIGCLQVSVVDLLSEARYAAKIREHPERGPDLMTYVWGGITLGSLVATASVGWMIENFGPSRVYLLVALLVAMVLIPTSLNWLEEEKVAPEPILAKLSEQRELTFLVCLLGFSTILLVGVGLLQDSIWVNLAVALAVSVAVVSAFSLLLRPVIGRMNCFFFIQTVCVVDISGASFFFFTDGPDAFPRGPHFSTTFFASGLGVCVALLNLLGMFTYNRFMQHWRYHALFIFANLLLCAVNCTGILVYTRTNLTVGIPDEAFVLGTYGIWAIVHMWMWLPGIVLLSQLCPRGVEATMYALLAGCHNLGLSVASYAGACLLHSLNVVPSGAANEGHQFDNLWVAAAIQAVAPVCTLVMLPWMIPNARQTDKLLQAGDTATDGSLWQRFFGTRRLVQQYGATDTSTPTAA